MVDTHGFRDLKGVLSVLDRDEDRWANEEISCSMKEQKMM
jgi:hypothetical protein